MKTMTLQLEDLRSKFKSMGSFKKRSQTITLFNSVFNHSINVSMKSKVIMLMFLLCCSNIYAQETNSPSEDSKMTTVLLTELDRKVHEIKKLEDKVTLNAWATPQDKENAIIQLDNAKKDVRIFIYNSLESRCRKENRLLEISNSVKLIDEKLADKYFQLSIESQNQK